MNFKIITPDEHQNIIDRIERIQRDHKGQGRYYDYLERIYEKLKDPINHSTNILVQGETYKRLMSDTKDTRWNNITITKEFTRKAKDLSPAALVLALQLANYIDAGGFITDSRGKAMNINDIHEASGYSEKTVKRSMAELAKQKIYNRTKCGKTNVYNVNPMYILGAK